MKSTIKRGLLIGAYLTAPMIALFYFFWKTAGLIFPPFMLFDWLTNILPGPLIRGSIEIMVKIIRGLNIGSTDIVAKTAEQLIGVVIFFSGGVFAGLISGLVIKLLKRPAVGTSSILAILYCIPLEIIIIERTKAGTANSIISELLVVICFFIWGILYGAIYNKITELSEEIDIEDTGRRKFLIRLAGATAALTIAGITGGSLLNRRKQASQLEYWSDTHSLPNAEAEVKAVPGTRPELTPVKDHYRIDINTTSPEVDINSWNLSFKGLLKNPVKYSMKEIRSFKSMDQFVTLECISNPVAGDLISTTRWTGVSMQEIIPKLGLNKDVTHFRIHSTDGFHETIALEEIYKDERIMLVYDWDGQPLPIAHGFPLRIYIPGRYGMKQPKWIELIEAVSSYSDGYWVKRGWDKNAIMQSTSVIDAVALHSTKKGQKGETLVPVGGIAFSGDKGISRVELQVDDGEWNPAQLRTPISMTTWVIWRYEYPYKPGKHKFTVRCFDGKGNPQIEKQAEPYPSGATGLHSVIVSM